MSAYMISDEDYQIIADWLLENGNDSGSDFCYLIRKFIGIDPKSDEFRIVTTEQLSQYIKIKMRKLYDLNQIAMVTRYGENFNREDKTQFVPKFQTYKIFDNEVIRKLKSLRYQCAEYIARETKLFDELDFFIAKICEYLFEYKQT